MPLQRFLNSSSPVLSLLLLFSAVACLLSSCDAIQFNVGGRDGWVTKPSEDYNHWAQRLRFQVNDTLFFKYKKGSDSVLLVTRDDFDGCRTDKPIEKMDDGNSVFKFNASGPFYFITSNKDNCQSGQKLVIVVLAVRYSQQPTPTTPVVPPTPAAAPPKGSTPSPASPAVSPSAAPPSPSSSPAGSLPPISPATAGVPGSGNSSAEAHSPPGSAAALVSPLTPSVMLVVTVLSLGLGGFLIPC